MSVWNPDNIKDVAESVGVTALNEDVLQALSSDVEYRLSQVLEEALKYMRHSRRNTLSTQDVAHALRVLDVEPLYGYESIRPLKFGEASIGPGQPLFYVEDEEVDFEKLINAPLPKVPREITFTAHWLAVEGVQPSIPQNPTLAESRNQELLPKGASANPQLAALSGTDPSSTSGGMGPGGVAVKPLVRHVLSKELQMYFEKVTSALLDELNDEYRLAALASLRSDPGLHQLVPYFIQFIAEKVTHNLKSLFVLSQMLSLASALLDNETLHVAPYVAALVPPILTCLISPRLGSATNPLEHYPVRSLAASILGLIARRHGRSALTLKPRLVRTCLKQFLDPKKPLPIHYGALMGIRAVAGREGVRVLIVPNLREYGVLLREALAAGPPGDKDAEMVVGAVMGALQSLAEEEDGKSDGKSNGKSGDTDKMLLTNGDGSTSNGAGAKALEGYREKLEDKVGSLISERVLRAGDKDLVQAILDC